MKEETIGGMDQKILQLSYDELYSAVKDEVDFWVNRSTQAEKYLPKIDTTGEYDRTRLIVASRNAYRLNPIARQAVEATVSHIVGSGIRFRVVDRDSETKKYFNEFCKETRFQFRCEEAIRRTLVDGTCLLRWFDFGKNKLKPAIRFLEPLRIKNVETDPEDVEVLRKIEYDSDDSGVNLYKINGKDVDVIKLFADSDNIFGFSCLEPVLKRLAQYEQWVLGRVLLNHAKSGYYIVRKVLGNSGKVQSVIDQTIKSTRSGMAQAAKLPPPGSMLTASEDVEYQPLSIDIDAKDVSEDGVRMLKDIASGIGMPFSILGSDAGGGNRAGSTVSEEGPWIKKILYFQGIFGPVFERMGEKVIKNAVDTGQLKKKSFTVIMRPEAESAIAQLEEYVRIGKGDDRRIARARADILGVRSSIGSYEKKKIDRITDIVTMWPEPVQRDMLKTTQSLEVMDRLGIASKQTIAGFVDLNYDEEREMIANERIPDITSDSPMLKMDFSLTMPEEQYVDKETKDGDTKNSDKFFEGGDGQQMKSESKRL
jgi:hypothetical protein